MIFDFLWHLRGSVTLEGACQSEITLDRVAGLLRKQYKPITVRTHDSLEFSAPLYRNIFLNKWLAMVIYDYGRFWIEKNPVVNELHFDLQSSHLFVFCLTGAAVIFGAGVQNTDLLHATIFGAATFGWLYGMNILLALVRVPRLIRSTVHGE